jgi:hypothetical protein
MWARIDNWAHRSNSLPTPDRVYTEHEFDNSFAIVLTVQCVSWWADRCAIGHSVTLMTPARKGRCPTISLSATL